MFANDIARRQQKGARSGRPFVHVDRISTRPSARKSVKRSVGFVIVPLQVVAVSSIDQVGNNHDTRENNQEYFLGRKLVQHTQNLHSYIARDRSPMD
jgi:hypothetical protein